MFPFLIGREHKRSPKICHLQNINLSELRIPGKDYLTNIYSYDLYGTAVTIWLRFFCRIQGHKAAFW